VREDREEDKERNREKEKEKARTQGEEGYRASGSTGGKKTFARTRLCMMNTCIHTYKQTYKQISK